MTTSTRFTITFDAGYAVLSRALFISPRTRTSSSWATKCRCGWGGRSARPSLARAWPARLRPEKESRSPAASTAGLADG